MKEKPTLFSGEMEAWRPVPGFEGRYEVSDQGRIRTLSTYHNMYGKILKPGKISSGYLGMGFRSEGKRVSISVHRLVMMAFVGPCPDGHQVAHNNGDRTDNRLENLRYATPSSNIDDRRRHGRTARGSRQGNSVLDEAAVKTIKALLELGFSTGEIAHLACVSVGTIQSIKSGDNWRHV